MSTPPQSDWKKRETLPSALIQIVVVAVVLVGAVLLLYKRGEKKKEMGEFMTEARSLAIKGNPTDIHAGLKVLETALEKDSGHAKALAYASALYTDLWLVHGEAGAEAKAKELLTKAKAADAQTDDRYGTEALHVYQASGPKAADDFVEEQFKKGASSARLFYAKALALKGMGNLTLSKAAFTAAMDKAWKDPQYATTWGEAVLEEGVPGALDTFNKALGTSPDYFRAKLGVALARVQKKDRVGDAETIVTEVLSKDASLSPYLRARGKAILALVANISGNSDQAIGLADESLKLNSLDYWALYAKASALAAKKDPMAVAAFTDLVSKRPSAPVFYFEGAKQLQAAGMSDAALALLDKYEAFYKNIKNQTAEGKEQAYLDRDDRYWLTRGDVQREAGKLDDAMASYEKAIAAKNVNVTKAYLSMATVLIAKKDYDKAGQMLTEITPPDGTGQLADAYMAMGEVLFAKKEYGPACQNWVFGLIRMKAQQAPREQMNVILSSVEKRLKDAKQTDLVKVWNTEAKTFIQ